MATLSFSVPDDVSNAFNQAFEGKDQNDVIADLMRKAVAELQPQARREQAFRLLTERRVRRRKLTIDEIRTTRMEDLP